MSRTTFFEHEDRYEDCDHELEILLMFFDIYIVCIYLNLKNYGEEAKNIYFFDEDLKEVYESLLDKSSKNERTGEFKLICSKNNIQSYLQKRY